jgi:tetratricopeptide (TPR) repeat protein
VYKDENAATLSRNYAAAHLQLGFDYRKKGNLQKGIEEFERISRMFPDLAEVLIPLGGFYLEKGDTAKAMALYQRLAQKNPGDPEARYYYGVSLLYENKLEDAVRELEAAITADPNFNYAYYAAYYSLWEAGQRERALSFLERWLSMHPADEQTRKLLAQQRSAIGGQPIRSNAPPPPPVPGLP